MDRNPACAASGVERRVQQRPVSNSIAAIFHALGFAVGRRHRYAIKMVAPDHDWRFNLALLHQIVHSQPKLRAFPIAQPADTRWQSLELDALARQVDPAAQDSVLREQLQDQVVSYADIGGITRERYPAERPTPFTEQRTNICGHKAGEIIG